MNTLTIRKGPVYLALLLFFSHVLCLSIFHGNARALAISSDLFQTIAPIISAFWLFQKHLGEGGKGRTFWLLLSLSLSCYAMGMLYLDYNEIYLQIPVPFPSLADLFFIGMYVFVLISFFYFLYLNRNVIHLGQILYDTFIVIAVAAPASWEYILKPILHILAYQGIWFKIFCVSYPIANLMLLFALMLVFNSSSMKFPSRVFLAIFFGTSCFLLADTLYLYLVSKGQYAPGNPIDLIWVLGNYLIGISPIFSHGHIFLKKDKADIVNINRKTWMRHFISLRLWIPYTGVFVLFLITSFQMGVKNSLIIGFILSILLIIFRQMATLADNKTLLEESTHLNKELETKVRQRTRQIDKKNQQLLEYNNKLQYMAYHDALTALPNRRFFESQLKKELSRAKGNNEKVAVLFIDLDRYKLINDTVGHTIGDLLLQKAAQRFQECVGDIGVVSRHGGDEFLILLPGLNRSKVTKIAEKILASSRKVFKVAGHELFITSSIGISMYPDNGEHAEELISRADAALYAIKKENRNQLLFFDSSMNKGKQENLDLEKDLRFAIKREELWLAYQPLVQVQTGEVKGVEALIRWDHPVKGSISPQMFIPVAEETGFMVPLGQWVLETACRQWRIWADKGFPKITMAVNISTNQFLHPHFLSQVRRVLLETGMDPAYLELEMTGNLSLVSTGTGELFRKLREMGIKISMDDFGTGYNSLQYLKHFPIHKLKIDRSFIRDIPYNPSDAAIVETILVMAHRMHLEVVAEGVERVEQLQFLEQYHCQTVQGFLFSKPVTSEEFERQYLFLEQYS